MGETSADGVVAPPHHVMIADIQVDDANDESWEDIERREVMKSL